MLEEHLAWLLASNHVLRLATMDGLAAPWIGAAFFVEHGLFELDLLLESGSKTVADVLIDPRAAVMVDSGPRGDFRRAGCTCPDGPRNVCGPCGRGAQHLRVSPAAVVDGRVPLDRLRTLDACTHQVSQ